MSVIIGLTTPHERLSDSATTMLGMQVGGHRGLTQRDLPKDALSVLIAPRYEPCDAGGCWKWCLKLDRELAALDSGRVVGSPSDRRWEVLPS